MPKYKLSLEDAAKLARDSANAVVLNPNAYVIAKGLQDKMNKIPANYIGGNTEEVRDKFWKQDPVMQHAVDSISSRYGINSDALRYRLNHEGFTDKVVNWHNWLLKNPSVIEDVNDSRGYNLLNGTSFADGFDLYGLDDVANLIDDGKVNLINESWTDNTDTNEKGRKVRYASGDTVADNIGILAATLKYFTDTARKDYPNASDYDINRYGLAYYNRGITGGRKWVKSGAKGYNYRRNLANGGSIYIKPSKRGTFTAAASRHGMGVQAFASKVLANKENYSPAMVKKANFARNASKWN